MTVTAIAWAIFMWQLLAAQTHGLGVRHVSCSCCILMTAAAVSCCLLSLGLLSAADLNPIQTLETPCSG